MKSCYRGTDRNTADGRRANVSRQLVCLKWFSSMIFFSKVNVAEIKKAGSAEVAAGSCPRLRCPRVAHCGRRHHLVQKKEANKSLHVYLHGWGQSVASFWETTGYEVLVRDVCGGPGFDSLTGKNRSWRRPVRFTGVRLNQLKRGGRVLHVTHNKFTFPSPTPFKSQVLQVPL